MDLNLLVCISFLYTLCILYNILIRIVYYLNCNHERTEMNDSKYILRTENDIDIRIQTKCE